MSTFRWAVIGDQGTETGVVDEAFDSREAAESWLGTHWADLLAGGAREVALHEGDAELYRMGLEEE
jgi:hypothetical protein